VLQREGLLAGGIVTLAFGIALAACSASAAQHGSVIIKRDDYGIPNIYADDIYSLYYGYGYALAEDRLFQIESERLAAQGRAAEVFGPEYLEKDIAILTNYDPDDLVPQLARLKGEHRQVFDGMVAGINARIAEVLASPKELMPKEFLHYGFEPRPWTDLDIAMSWMGQYLLGFADYTSQISNQAFLSELTEKYGKETAQRIFASLRWKSDPTAPTTVQKIDQIEGRAVRGMQSATTSGRPQLRLLSTVAAAAHVKDSLLLWDGVGPDRTPHASNVWLVNGPKLADADAILYNGPQVGDYVPSRIWSASLHGAGLDVTGSTYPGLPYFHYGTNGDIAWGRTALAGSIIDIYQEQLHPEDPHRYRHKGQWLTMERRTRTILVKGGEPVRLDLYRTVHGPVILFDEKNHTAYSKKRSWTGHELETILAYYEEMKARSYEQWKAEIARKANNQNQYYADKYGNIAYKQAGRYPLRPPGHDVQLPSPGTGEMEWTGIQPFEYNAEVFNPRSGYIANWNNRPSPDILNTDTLLWSKLDRVDAIFEKLEAKPKLTTLEVWDVNRSVSYASEQYRYFAPLIRDAVRGLPADSRVKQVADALLSWNGQQVDAGHSGVYSSPGVAIYYEWLTVALEKLYGPVLPEKYLGGCESKIATFNCPYGQPLSAAVLYFTLTKGSTGSPVPQYDFLEGQDPGEFIRATLEQASEHLAARYGPDVKAWLAPVKPKIWHTDGPLGEPWTLPENKLVYEPDQKRGSMSLMFVFRNGKVTMCDAVPPGQSGFIAPDGRKDPHFEDQQRLYTGFDCKPRRITKEEVDAHTVSTRRLTF
jgi:penicillin amidase